MKDRKALANLFPAEPVVWDSNLLKFNKRLQLMRKQLLVGEKSDVRSKRMAGIRDVPLYEFFLDIRCEGCALDGAEGARDIAGDVWLQSGVCLRYTRHA